MAFVYGFCLREGEDALNDHAKLRGRCEFSLIQERMRC